MRSLGPRFYPRALGAHTDDPGFFSSPFLQMITATFGAIVGQNTSFGFSLFPGNTSECYNTYAGIFGLAYQGQAAGPSPGGGTTNGTSVPLFDQLVATGTRNAFGIEICPSYPYSCSPRGRADNTTWLGLASPLDNCHVRR